MRKRDKKSKKSFKIKKDKRLTLFIIELLILQLDLLLHLDLYSIYLAAIFTYRRFNHKYRLKTYNIIFCIFKLLVFILEQKIQFSQKINNILYRYLL